MATKDKMQDPNPGFLGDLKLDLWDRQLKIKEELGELDEQRRKLTHQRLMLEKEQKVVADVLKEITRKPASRKGA